MTSTGRLAGSAAVLAARRACAREWPEKPITWIVPFPAAGPTTQRWSALVKAANIRLE
jgi:tripartite-type tricarboxylate transporter receptor subunit TctC